MSNIAAAFDTIRAMLPAGIQMRLGEEWMGELTQAPNIVWVPREDTFAPASESQRTPCDQRSRATISTGIEARILGAAASGTPGTNPDLTMTERLRDRLIVALRDSFGANIRLESGMWMPVSTNQQGMGYVLRFRLEFPVIPQDDDSNTTTTTFTDVSSTTPPPPAMEVKIALTTDELVVPPEE
jgi:hypothetical protein